MKFAALSLLLLLIISVSSSVHCGNGSHRRILHQPLYPEESSYLPPDTDLLPPDADQPFFPDSGTQDQTPPPPPPPSVNINGSILPISTATTKPHTNQTKKAAIAISIGIAVLGMLSAFIILMICRNKTKKHPVDEPPKMEGFNGDGSRFLYIGTMEPNSTKRSASDTMKMTQQPKIIRPFTNRNSPINAPSSPDVIKHAIIPSIKKTPPRLQPLPPERKNNGGSSVFELKSSLPKRAKFGPRTPPPPNLALLQSIINQSLQPPPPPPPLPPPPSLLAQQVTMPPKVRSTWTNFIKKPSDSEAIELGSGGSFFSGKSNGDQTEETKPKLKPLHWEKSLFCCNSNKLVKNESNRKPVLPPVVVLQENRVLDPKKSQNIAILLRALNVTRDEVSEALLDVHMYKGNTKHETGNTRALGAEVLETLVKMAPTKEEEIKLTGYEGDTSKLGSAERFLKAVLDVPFAFKRVESMLYRANFDAQVKYLNKSFQTLEEASSELKNSRLFLKLLEAVLTTGNRMNVGTNRGGAKSFTLDTLLKLVDIKGTDGKTTLLHFVVQEIIRSEGKESVTVTGLSREVSSVKLAACMDSDVLHSSVSKLETGLQKVRTALEYEKSDEKGKFFESMKAFYRKAEKEICRIKESERKAFAQVREVTEYFHGDLGNEETLRLGIFVTVRDFLLMLDFVCKDVGIIQDRPVIGESRSLKISSNVRLDYSSSEEIINAINQNQPNPPKIFTNQLNKFQSELPAQRNPASVGIDAQTRVKLK
ncbi:hypothetical protein V2J09_009839 [Rumex salicifolius]